MCKTETLKEVAILYFQLTQLTENNCMSLKDMVPKSVFGHSGRVQLLLKSHNCNWDLNKSGSYLAA